MNRRIILLSLWIFMSFTSFSQMRVHGTVRDADGPISFAHVGIKYSDIRTLSDEDGNYQLDNIPIGSRILQCSFVGYTTFEKSIFGQPEEEIRLEIELEKSFSELDEVVITGSRTEQKRTESPVVVGVINKNTLENTQANTLADGLNFQSGLRMETDCQTCGYSQLRMNGLGGAYSMILIDSRPIFSNMMGLYGLEQIPTNIIDRIEVVRGGGSAVYGSNAVAGTVNVITKEPSSDYIDVAYLLGIIDKQSVESNLNAAFSKVFDRAGITVHGSRNTRDAYDANADGFSELPKLDGYNYGLNGYYNIGKYGKIGLNLNGLNEYRRGGNYIDKAAIEADQAEERDVNILLGGTNYTSAFPNLNSSLDIYIAGQQMNRQHYTGIDHADAYGTTIGRTFMGGFQYNYFSNTHTVTLGSEFISDYINDEIPLYNYLIDQQTTQYGTFLQDEWKWSNRFTLLAGLRLDKHSMVDQLIINPRLNLLYKPLDNTQIRASYSSGFRAPQAFDTDLHIAFAGGGLSMIELDPNLQEETSKSYSLSINYDRPAEKYIYGFTIESFHTKLYDAFVLEENGEDEIGNKRILKKNGNGSTVQGVSIEGRLNYNAFAELNLGITFQNSRYDEPVRWSADLEASDQYLRTPEHYGFYILDINPAEQISISLSGVYTGGMLVPHFGGAPGVPSDIVIESNPFFDQNIKLSYQIPVKSIKQGLQLFAGVKNVFNSYQDDFDTGRYRDSNYVYGPARPRTIFFGIQLASLQ